MDAASAGCCLAKAATAAAPANMPAEGAVFRFKCTELMWSTRRLELKFFDLIDFYKYNSC